MISHSSSGFIGVRYIIVGNHGGEYVLRSKQTSQNSTETITHIFTNVVYIK